MASAQKYKKTSSRSSASKQLSLSKFLVGAALGAALGWVALKPSFTTGLVALIGMSIAAVLATLALRGKGRMRLSSSQTMAIAVASVAALAGVQAVGSSAADDCRPEPKVTKAVRNITTGSALHDANSASKAVPVKPGDIIDYVITVTNVAPEARDRRNDVVNVSITDLLPEGVEMVDKPGGPRLFTDQLTDITPRKGVIKTYRLKVTSTTDGQIQQNHVCLNSNGIHGNKPTKYCDVAFTKVSVPPAPPAPAPAPVVPVEVPPAPAPEQPIVLPAVLPQTGPGNIAVIVAMAIATGYLFSLLYAHMKSGKRGTSA